MSRVDMFLCGDVMTGRGIDQILAHPSEPTLYEDYVKDARDYVALAEQANGPVPRPTSFAYVWGDALEELGRRAPHARIVNLETSVTRIDEPWPDKGINYRMHPDNVACLLAANIDICNLANNHVLDWGRAGLVETLETLHGAGIRTTGAGHRAAEADDIAIVDAGPNRRVLVLGVAHRSSGVPPTWAATQESPGVAVLPRLDDGAAAALGDRLARVRAPGDVSVVSIHWGSNWGYEVPDSHVRFAHALVDGGVDVVHGHSSHHPRPIEIYRGRPILYGCGDFLSDYEGIRGFEAFRADLVLMYFACFARGELVEVTMTPMRIRKMRLERVSPDDAAWLKATLCSASAPFGTNLELTEAGDLTVR